MHNYKVFLKDGTSTYAECKWVDIITLDAMLDDSKHFIKLGDNIFAKDFIAHIHKVELTTKTEE